MKAAVLYEPNKPLEIVDLEQQGPQAGEARVRVKAAGVCHSDWHIMNGDWQLPLPMVLGHEAAGIVEEVGAGVANVKPRRPRDLLLPAAMRACAPARSAAPSCATGASPCAGPCSTGPIASVTRGRTLNQMARIGTFSGSRGLPLRDAQSAHPQGDAVAAGPPRRLLRVPYRRGRGDLVREGGSGRLRARDRLRQGGAQRRAGARRWPARA
jgi:hypothetical protein